MDPLPCNAPSSMARSKHSTSTGLWPPSWSQPFTADSCSSLREGGWIGRYPYKAENPLFLAVRSGEAGIAAHPLYWERSN